MTSCGSNCWRLRFSLENRSTLILAVTADLPGLLRPAARASEIAVIEPPYALDERGVAPFTLTHNELNSLRPIYQPRQRRKSGLFGFSIPSCSSIRNECGFSAPQRASCAQKNTVIHTSSSRASKVGGTSIPSERAVCRFRSIRIWLIANQANWPAWCL
jgi:hypothetical protein